MMRMRATGSWLLAVALALSLSGCGSQPAPAPAPTRPRPAPTPVAATVDAPLEKLSCAAEIGAAAAARKVAICRNLSPATHPPCNAANSCAMIDGEIARSCAIIADDETPPGCGPAS